jgi:hypothetical protein
MPAGQRELERWRYGVPRTGLHAVAGAFVADALSPGMGVVFVIAALGCSLAAALFSPLRAVRSFTTLRQGEELIEAKT